MKEKQCPSQTTSTHYSTLRFSSHFLSGLYSMQEGSDLFILLSIGLFADLFVFFTGSA